MSLTIVSIELIALFELVDPDVSFAGGGTVTAAVFGESTMADSAASFDVGATTVGAVSTESDAKVVDPVNRDASCDSVVTIVDGLFSELADTGNLRDWSTLLDFRAVVVGTDFCGVDGRKVVVVKLVGVIALVCSLAGSSVGRASVST